MRLKSLKLAGFKSFANPTTFTFRHGISAIVGPNGCGKSNVIDAIRWVLGESSAKQLRGGAMSDVIFAGTQDKPAKSLASVELTFQHTQDEQTGIRHELNIYHELSVRRQVNIEGKSDYFINGTKCRRRDVVDVFLGTGLGPRSYSVIQQGMIGRIVDSSPLQLREFIEEAAGVSRYQARREETQKKLAKTRENVDRLNDVKAELTQQKKKLAKQAQRANDYQCVVEELNRTKEQLAIKQLHQAKSTQMHFKAKQEELSAKVDTLQQTIKKTKEHLAKLNERLAEEQWLKDKVRDQLHEQDMRRQKSQHRLASIEEKITQLDYRLRVNNERQSHVKKEVSDSSDQVLAQSNMISSLAPKLQELEQQKQQYDAQLLPLQTKWTQVNSEKANLDNTKRSIEQKIALNQQALERLQLDKDNWQNRERAWQAEAKKWQVAIDEHGVTDSFTPDHASEYRLELSEPDFLDLAPKLQQLDSELMSLSNQQDDIADRLEVDRPELANIEHYLKEKQTQYGQLEKKHASLTGEYDTLHAIVYPVKPTSLLSDNNLSAEGTRTNDDAGHNENNNNNNNNYKSNDLSIDHVAAEKLSALLRLQETIELTALGKSYAHVLDQWLSFWLDSVILDKQANAGAALDWSDLMKQLSRFAVNSKQLSDTDLDAKHLQSEYFNHVFLAQHDGVRIKTTHDISATLYASASVAARHDKPNLIPLTQLIAQPNLSLWQACYLYDDSNQVAPSNHKEDSQLINATVGKETTNTDPIDNVDFHKEATEDIANILAQLPAGSFLLTHSGWLMGHSIALPLSKLNGEAQNEQFLTIRLQQQQRLQVLEVSLDSVETEIETLDKAMKLNKSDYERLKVVIEELSAQLQTLTQRQYELKQQKLELSAKQEQWQREQTRLVQQRRELDSEREALSQAQTKLNDSLRANRTAIATLTPKLESLTVERNDLERQQQLLKDRQQEDNNTLTQLQFNTNKAELALEHAQSQLHQSKDTLKQLEHAQKKLSQDLQQTLAERPKLENKVSLESDATQQLTAALKEHNTAIETLKADIAARQRQQNDSDQTLNEYQSHLSEYSTQVAVANERIQETSERLLALDADISPETVLADFVAHRREISAAKVQELQASEQQLTARLSAMSPVNLAAASELAAVEARLLPLEQQIDDITNSMNKLVDAIASIDVTTKSLFLDTLDSVNQSLSDLFTKVFGGGRASLSLVKDESLAKSDHWRAGLELMAQPKGKKNSRLAVLSGGEKTLTALSLIFAIFKQHPAPFCVLDEVDAPLDDANVARFTHLIKELAQEVQFIFISHNKLAMQIADDLKGITMPQAGISSLVSVSLEEAERYLEPTV